jgi:hypothetical protein
VVLRGTAGSGRRLIVWVADVVVAALQARLGLDVAAAEAVVNGLRRHEPAQDALAVYLDLNHWVWLAKAQVGHPDGAGFRTCLDVLTAAVDSGTVILPLGVTHYQEVANIGQCASAPTSRT